MTVLDLLARLKAHGCEPTIEGFNISFTPDPPAALDPFVELLQSGVRAKLTGRKWYGVGHDGRGAGRPDGTLSFGELLPEKTHMLTVEGDPQWDRIAWHCSREVPTASAFAESRSKKGAA